MLREKGVSAATLDDVMARTQTSKSQLFHYFPAGKDELLLAVAQYEADQVLEDQQPYLGCLDSWEAWQQWRDVVVERYEEQGDQCPLGSLFLHLGRSTPGARAIVVELMRRWQASLAAGIRALQAAGHLPADLDVDQRAAALLAAIQGGVSILLSTGGPTTCGPRSIRGSATCGALRPEADPPGVSAAGERPPKRTNGLASPFFSSHSGIPPAGSSGPARLAGSRTSPVRDYHVNTTRHGSSS